LIGPLEMTIAGPMMGAPVASGRFVEPSLPPGYGELLDRIKAEVSCGRIGRSTPSSALGLKAVGADRRLEEFAAGLF
jgi:hypothetical protein